MSRPGNLFYVVGASGTGKDALLAWVRDHLGTEDRVVFAHRYITRPVDSTGENHISLTEKEYERLRRIGCFAMQWRSHGLGYGIGIEIDQWLHMGLNVVVNGSRAYLEQAAKRYAEMVPLLIEASREVIRERLIRRGRETPEQIELRLKRNHELGNNLINHPNLITIDNSGHLEEAGSRLRNIFLHHSP